MTMMTFLINIFYDGRERRRDGRRLLLRLLPPPFTLPRLLPCDAGDEDNDNDEDDET